MMTEYVPLTHRIVAEGLARRKVISLLLTGGEDTEVGLWQQRWEHALRHLWREKYGVEAPEVLRPWKTPETPYLTAEQVRQVALSAPKQGRLARVAGAAKRFLRAPGHG